MGKAESKRFAEGDVICHQGDPADSLFILQQGRVAVVVYPGPGSQTSHGSGQGGHRGGDRRPRSAMLGEAGLFLHKPHRNAQGPRRQNHPRRGDLRRGGAREAHRGAARHGAQALSEPRRPAAEPLIERAPRHRGGARPESLTRCASPSGRPSGRLGGSPRGTRSRPGPRVGPGRAPPRRGDADPGEGAQHAGHLRQGLEHRREPVRPGSTLFNQNDEGNSCSTSGGIVEVFMVAAP